MLTIPLYNQSGANVGTVEVSPELFGVPSHPGLIHEAVVAQSANARVAIADTKGRGEVRGGGKKPWKQKGTGRARHGSIRSPLWKGGGVTFGPTSLRNFAKKINRKAKRRALASVLSDALSNDRFLVVDSLLLPAAKTRVLKTLLNALPSADVRTLVVVEEANTGVGKAAENLQDVDVIPVHCLNVKEALKAGRLVVSKEALTRMQELFVSKASV